MCKAKEAEILMKRRTKNVIKEKGKDMVKEAVKQDGEALQYASMELKGNKEVVMEANKSNGEALRYASEEQKGDKEVQQFYIGEEHEKSAGTKKGNLQKNESSTKKYKKKNQDFKKYIMKVKSTEANNSETGRLMNPD
eukprot:11996578-Heterocapsa_arctica.AAC.1